MPGNEVSDKVHNFFDQSSVSQEQRHTQFVEGNWAGIHNNVWGANERQIGGPLTTSSMNYSSQQSEIERGQNNPFSLASHGLNYGQSGVRPEFGKSPSQAQQLNLNGFMHAPQTVNTRQNEANFLGVNRGSDGHNMISRGVSNLESQQRSTPQHNSSASFGGSDTPMNFNFFGGQQQMSGQQSGMLQSLPLQQSGNNDAQAQLMQQQIMFRQMQELQRRQQYQQFEAMQRNAMNNMSAFGNQPAGQHSLSINGNPVQDASNYPLQSQVMAGGTNWQQRGHPSAVPAYSNGLMVHPEQGQPMRFTGLTPQHASQSLFGVPVTNSAGANPFSQNSMNKPAVFHTLAPSNPFSSNSYAPHAEQGSIQEASTASRSGSEGKASFEHASSQAFENAVDLGGFNQVQQRKVSMSDAGERGFVGGSDVSPEIMQTAASQSTSSQAAVGLDPTEEKILFGNDVNIWDAFGETSVSGNDGSDVFNGLPSMQSGTWSALMQSAVAETSSSDVGMQEEWSGLDPQNSRSQPRNQHFTASQDNEKPSPVWADSSQRASFGSRTTSNDPSASIAAVNANHSHNPNLQQPVPNLRRSPVENTVLQEGRRWLDSSSPKPHAEEKRVPENPSSCKDSSKVDTGFWSHQQSTFLPESIPDSNINSKVESGGPDLRKESFSHESGQRRPDIHSLDLWKQVNFASKPGFVSSGNDQHNMNTGQSAVNPSVYNPVSRVTEMHGIENGDGTETSNDSHQNSFLNPALPGDSKENVWSGAGGGVSVSRKFQYHPMGDVHVDDTSKEVLHSQSMSRSSRFGVHEEKPPLVGPAGSSLLDMEKGRASAIHGGVAMSHGGPSSSVHPGYLTSMSAPFARPGENSFQIQHLPPGQNMLELLDKVDQSTDQNAVSKLGSSSTNYNRSSDIPSGGLAGPGQSQPSLSHSFNLQLAPPSQGFAFSNLNDPGRSILRSVGSSSPQLASSDRRDNSHSRLDSGSTAQSLPPSDRPTLMDSGNDIFGGLDGSLSNTKGSGLPGSLASNSTYLRNAFQNQHMTAAGGQMMNDHQSSTVSSVRHAYQDQQSTINQNQQSGMRTSLHQMPPVHPVMGKDNMSSGGPYLRTPQQQLFGVQARNGSDFMKSHFQPNDSLGMNSFDQQKKDEMDGPRSSDVVSSPVVADGEEPTVADPRYCANTEGVSREESLGRQSMEASPSNSAASQKNADAFLFSVKPNNMAHHNHSLLHQMRGMEAIGMDPSHRESKRLSCPENGPDVPQMAGKVAEPSQSGLNSMVGDPLSSQTSVSSVDAKMLSFSSQSGNRNFGRSDPPTFTGNVTGRPLMSISPQMAPSWFEQYGTSKNGELLQVHNVPRDPAMMDVEQPSMKPPDFIIQNSAQLENAVIDNTSQITNLYAMTEHMSSPSASTPHLPSLSLAPMRPKKRKTATSDLLPWNTEIGQGFKKIHNLSSAEADWAQSSNRLVERGGDETDSHEDLSPIIRPRRRLILTTKLMQQVFCPPSASILSLDGRSNYEVIMYSVARLALGDSCNLICGMESDAPSENRNENSLSGKAKTSRRIPDQYFSKVMEDFTNRAKELDNELLRLDKRTSILDFRLDCQELERFSLINRFVRFHGRSQVDGVETSSSSDANAVSQKHFPQRYVSAHPMPRTVPDRVQCLTLN